MEIVHTDYANRGRPFGWNGRCPTWEMERRTQCPLDGGDATTALFRRSYVARSTATGDSDATWAHPRAPRSSLERKQFAGLFYRIPVRVLPLSALFKVRRLHKPGKPMQRSPNAAADNNARDQLGQ